MAKKARTISKHFDDCEILFKDPITGDLHLKEGVTRLKYQPLLDPQLTESYLNFEDLAIKRQQQIEEQLGLNQDNYEDNY